MRNQVSIVVIDQAFQGTWTPYSIINVDKNVESNLPLLLPATLRGAGGVTTACRWQSNALYPTPHPSDAIAAH